MSTGNDTAQPIDQTPPQDQSPSADKAPVAEIVSEIVDVDEAELNAAIAEAKAEETGATQQEEQPPAPAAPKEPAGQQDQPTQPVAMIPKPRFDQVLSEADQLRQQNAYLKGQLDARLPAAQAAGTAPAPQPQAAQTPEQRLAAIKAARLAIAAQFDEGEIDRKTEMAKYDELAEREHAIREEILLSKVQPAAKDEDDIYLEDKTAEMEEAHPWTLTIDALGEADAVPIWNFIQQRAVQNLVSRGIDPTEGKIGTLRLRNEMARLTDTLGPVLAGDLARAKGIALPGTPAPPTPTQPQQQRPQGPSTTAQARAAALAKQASAPPDITALPGHGGNPGGLPTDQALEAMSEADYDALPKATRDRLRGITAA